MKKELINEINDINKQIEAINLKIEEKQKEVDEAFNLTRTLSKEKGLLYDKRHELYARVFSLNRMVEMPEPYGETT